MSVEEEDEEEEDEDKDEEHKGVGEWTVGGMDGDWVGLGLGFSCEGGE